ncbi:MAG: protein kinase [Gammaproteobacteria bacterium]|nr:protein kinase [Gammaproteobacteria bacterium]
MAIRLLIIDENAAFRTKLKRLIVQDWPAIEVHERDPKDLEQTSGWTWNDYDLLFLDRLFEKDENLEWLRVLLNQANFPPTVVLSAHADPDVAVRAIKVGAENYLTKTGLTRSKLNATIDDLLKNILPKRAAANGKIVGANATNTQLSPADIVNAPLTSSVTQPPAAPADFISNTVRSQLNNSLNNLVASANPYTSSDLTIGVIEWEQPALEYIGGDTSHVDRGNVSKGGTVRPTVNKKLEEDPSLWPKIPGHRVLNKEGQGGMSRIYLAEREADGKQVVIKTLSAHLMDHHKTVERARQEFRLISRITNRHIVRLYEQGMTGNEMYTTMEYFPGNDLKYRLREGITARDGLSYMMQMAKGLVAIHGCGVIHRDLKPANIMFRTDQTLAIIDFGISRDINSRLDLTMPGQIMGTPNYMAPEQGNATYRPDARSDIYALGVMLYEMLTGKKPYAAPNSAAIIYKHLHDPIPKLPNQFWEMQVLIDRCMAKFPHQRFQSAYDLLQFIHKEFRWDLTLDFDENSLL